MNAALRYLVESIRFLFSTPNAVTQSERKDNGSIVSTDAKLAVLNKKIRIVSFQTLIL